MKCLILPGYSPHNREWAEAIAADLDNAVVHPWAHWETGGKMDPAAELAAILKKIGSDRTHLLAKSVGCRMALHVFRQIPNQIDRVILCGIPSVDVEVRNALESVLSKLPAERLLVVQNSGDPYAAHAAVARMFAGIAPEVQVLERPRDDHHYPYPDDFRAFLAGQPVT